MQETLSYIPKSHFTIADAKRGDIGNTSTQYAKAFFEAMDFDAITVAPYMGEDSIRPFLESFCVCIGLVVGNLFCQIAVQVQTTENRRLVV